MNRSIVVIRYVTALVKYARESGQGELVCTQAEVLGNTLRSVPDLRRMLSAADDVVPSRDKLKLLEGALEGKMAPELDRFLELLATNGRMDMAEDILRNYVDAYRRSMGVRKAHLITVSTPPQHLLDQLKALVKEKTGDDVLIETEVDPSLIGGFVFDIDDYLMDASVKRQLDLIREQFIERNRRII